MVALCQKGKALLARLKDKEGGRYYSVIVLAALTLYTKKHFPDLLEEIAAEE